MRRRGDDSGVPVVEDPGMSSTEIRAHLLELAQERIAAERAGLEVNEAYMADLEQEIVTYRRALVASAVTEIAVLRGELFGREQG
jgi:hypothetical protein